MIRSDAISTLEAELNSTDAAVRRQAVEQLAERFRSGEAKIHAERVLRVHSVSELIDYIRERHAEYLAKKRCVADDIAFILSVCYQVVSGMVQLLMGRESVLEAVII